MREIRINKTKPKCSFSMLEEVGVHNNRCMDQQRCLVDIITIIIIKHHTKEQVCCCYHMVIDIIVIGMADWIVGSIDMVATIITATITTQMVLLWIVIIELSIDIFAIVAYFELDWFARIADLTGLLAAIAEINSM